MLNLTGKPFDRTRFADEIEGLDPERQVAKIALEAVAPIAYGVMRPSVGSTLARHADPHDGYMPFIVIDALERPMTRDLPHVIEHETTHGSPMNASVWVCVDHGQAVDRFYLIVESVAGFYWRSIMAIDVDRHPKLLGWLTQYDRYLLIFNPGKEVPNNLFEQKLASVLVPEAGVATALARMPQEMLARLAATLMVLWPTEGET